MVMYTILLLELLSSFDFKLVMLLLYLKNVFIHVIYLNDVAPQF